MDALVLAAGEGRRLRPLTLTQPKPALPFLHAPMIRFALRAVVAAGATRVFVNAFHRAKGLASLLPPLEAALGVPLELVREPVLRGTGGALGALAGRVKGDLLLVVNGDVLVADALGPLVAAHRAGAHVATMLVTRAARPELPRSVGVAGGRVRVLRQGAPGSHAPRVFTGAHAISREGLASLPALGDVVDEGYLPWLRAGASVGAVEAQEAWEDLGTLARFAEAQLAPAPAFADAPGVHPGARVVEGARLGRVVLGPGAIVAGDADLDEVVVLPGARVGGRWRRVVVPASGPPVPF
ncbi:MAG: NDP-sugar synthase [Myxococcota bacterium]